MRNPDFFRRATTNQHSRSYRFRSKTPDESAVGFRTILLPLVVAIGSMLVAPDVFLRDDLSLVASALQAPTRLQSFGSPRRSKLALDATGMVQEMPSLQKAYLRQQSSANETSPYCFVLSSILDLPSKSNFLATQVWPSARVAAMVLEERLFGSDSHDNCYWNGSKIFESGENLDSETNDSANRLTICELGCGPGLPSIAMAAAAKEKSLTNTKVIATDLDTFGLQLVDASAKDQGLEHILSTQTLDLIELGETFDSKMDWLWEVDLFVLSDVFESEAVAIGAAKFTHRLLLSSMKKCPRVWVFAQTDRAQREVYLETLQCLFRGEDDSGSFDASSLKWDSPDSYSIVHDRLWLCDVDETKVNYG